MHIQPTLPPILPISPEQPIGIFDSGIGGLTVAKAVVELLPNESIVYFGDTARLPYGDKSAATICTYALEITDLLLQRNCKMILIACNSISAAAYNEIKAYIGNRALLVNVIDPLIHYLVQHYKNKIIGLIGTRQTVKSNIYHKKISASIGSGQNNTEWITLRALATPLLVPIIEEGFFAHSLVDLALQEYLSHEILSDIDALVLGCTHYPVIKDSICKYYGSTVEVIDASYVVAREVKEQLLQHELLRTQKINTDTNMEKNVLREGNRTGCGACYNLKQFYVSDYTEAFATSAKMFFGEDINIELYSPNT